MKFYRLGVILIAAVVSCSDFQHHQTTLTPKHPKIPLQMSTEDSTEPSEDVTDPQEDVTDPQKTSPKLGTKPQILKKSKSQTQASMCRRFLRAGPDSAPDRQNRTIQLESRLQSLPTMNTQTWMMKP